MNDTVTLKLIRHGETTIEVDRATYEQAKARGQVAYLLDDEFYRMSTSALVVETDGTEYEPTINGNRI